MITSGRGVFVSVLIGILVARLSGSFSSGPWLRLLAAVLTGLTGAFVLQFFFSDWENATHVVSRSIQGEEPGSGRLFLWEAWLKSFVFEPGSWLSGRGFNFVPDDLLRPSSPANPHNLYLSCWLMAVLLELLLAF